MSNEAFKEIMGYLDIIESELNKVSALHGGPTFDQWMKDRRPGISPLPLR